MGQERWQNFSTQTVVRPQRIHRWNEFGSETLGSMAVDPKDRDGFNASLSRIEFGSLGLVHMRSNGATAHGNLGAVGGWAAPEKDALLLIAPEHGESLFRQDHKELLIRPGDLMIRDLSKSWVHSCDGELDMLMVKIPFTALLPRVDDPTRLLEMTLQSTRPAVAMAVDVIRAVSRTLRSDPDEDLHDAMADLVLSSVGMIYSSMPHRAQPTSDLQHRAAIRRDAKNYIIRHLDDSDLTVDSVARALGMGKRKLQRAFVEIGETPSQYILCQRLDQAAREIAQGRGGCRNSILDIALSVGFNDASHFSRSFSRRFGVAPRNYLGTPPVTQ